MNATCKSAKQQQSCCPVLFSQEETVCLKRVFVKKSCLHDFQRKICPPHSEFRKRGAGSPSFLPDACPKFGHPRGRVLLPVQSAMRSCL